MHLWRSYLPYLIAILLSAGLTSCMVGPNFHPPAPPVTQNYTRKPIPKKTVSTQLKSSNAGKTQRFVYGRDIPAEWWRLFHSPQLNQLILQGIANSPNLEAAQYALQQAQETLKAQIGASFFPSINVQPSFQRERFSGAYFGASNFGTTFNLYTGLINVNYTLDIFGGLRRQVEGYRAQVDYENYELQAAYLTLTANIVATAINIASLQAQIDATQELIQLQQQNLNIVNKQYRLGGASGSDILTQETQLAQTQASLPPLLQSLSEYQHALAVLVGSFPSEMPPLKLDLNQLNLPGQLPVSIPCQLVQQRPDIQAAQALLHQANAQIGVATANMLPQVAITGFYGAQSNFFNEFFTTLANTWSITAQLTQPIFQGGALFHKRRAAIAARNQAFAQYKQVVLQAFQNVADTLRAIQHDAQALKAENRAEKSAQANLVITEKQYRLGGVSFLQLLNSERQYQQTKINRIQAQTARYTDTVALFQAMGGCWWYKNA